MSDMTIPIGKAAIMDTVCRFAIVPSEKIKAIGSIIRRMAQRCNTGFSRESCLSAEKENICEDDSEKYHTDLR